MKILLCSSDEAITKRWQNFLAEAHETSLCSSGSAMSLAILQNDIDLVLLHRSMATQDMIRAIKECEKECRIFILSDKPDDEEGLVFLKLGAIGYANTYIAESRLKEAVRVTLEDKVWVGNSLMQKLIHDLTQASAPSPQSPTPPPEVSPREWEVAQWIGEGLSNQEIAGKMNISERTVKSHISALFQKTGRESRLQLALLVKNLS